MSKGYGFIEGSDGTDYFAHFSRDSRLKVIKLIEGAAVTRRSQEMEKKDQLQKIL